MRGLLFLLGVLLLALVAAINLRLLDVEQARPPAASAAPAA